MGQRPLGYTRSSTIYAMGISCIHSSLPKREDPMGLSPPNIKPSMEIPIKTMQRLLTLHSPGLLLPLGQDAPCSSPWCESELFAEKTPKLKAVYYGPWSFQLPGALSPSPYLAALRVCFRQLSLSRRTLAPKWARDPRQQSDSHTLESESLERTFWNCPNPGFL